MITIDILPRLTSNVLFVSGIDTNVGKTVATAAIANGYKKMGYNVITQKMIQTGCKEISEDIERHRELMEMPMLDIDKDGTTSPVILSYPSSPHLAAEIDNSPIEISKIESATERLLKSYHLVLIEGAGGLMVPISQDNKYPLGGYLTIDYIKEHNYQVVLVTSGKLGSLNHTLLSIDACKQRGIEIAMIVYNLYPNLDKTITDSSLKYLNSLGIPLVTLNAMP